VSSYTPTLNTLLRPPASPINPNSLFKMMVVIQPATSGHSPLPSTRDELLKIERCVPAEFLVKLGLPEEPASVESVLAHLQTCSIAHFACHGVQNVEQPLDSALILEGGRELKISRIMELFTSNTSLAFLSACQTAATDGNLPDESIHIAASLLFAGFRGAVATMW
jgi:CHAT domain-containing protein